VVVRGRHRLPLPGDHGIRFDGDAASVADLYGSTPETWEDDLTVSDPSAVP
jgi:hypothetical protein